MKKIYMFNLAAASLIMLLSVFVLINVVYAKSTGSQPRIFGYSFHVVVSDSMTPRLNVGDFIVAKKTGVKDIKTGDGIIFNSPDPKLRGMLIVHKVVNIYTQNGTIYFQTSGIKEGAVPDEYPVSEIIGKYVWKSAFLGKAVIFLSDLQNILFVAVIASISAVAYRQIKNIIKIKKETKKQ